MDTDFGGRRREPVQKMVEEATEVVGVGVEATLEPFVPLAGQPVELVERAFPEPPGVGRKPLARRRHELRRDVDAEVVELRPAFTDQLEHDAGSAAHIEHRCHPLEQFDRLEAGRMITAFVARAEKVADLIGLEVPPGFSEPHDALCPAAEKWAVTTEAPSASRP